MDAASELISADLSLTLVVSAFSLLAVWFPLYRGLRVCIQARAATRRLDATELKQSLRSPASGGVEPLAAQLVRVLRKSLRESQREANPTEFVVDATKQYVVNEYDSHYAQLISMYANILPPLGFIGTTVGMLILFFSMHLSNESLELSALALALTSSIFALIGFAVLEAMKIRLYARLLACIDGVLSLQRGREEAPLRGAGTAGEASPA